MLQRVITGVISVIALLVVVYFRGWLFDIAISALAVFGCYEMIGAFQKAGITPPKWPIYGAAVLMLPVYLLLGSAGTYILIGSTAMVIMLQIVLRRHPQWPDAAAALNVMLSVPIPIILMYPIVRIQPEELGAVLLFAIFFIALTGDTFAYFVGVSVGTHKMVPELSPKKTWEGAAGGLIGSIVCTTLLGMVGSTWTPMPPLWHFTLLGLIGGIAGQLGDLSASLIKRYCGIKDFGTMFPGHGGMLDRFDSILFVTYVVFGYCIASGLL